MQTSFKFVPRGTLDNKSALVKVPDSKVHGANMGPTWVLSASDGPHVGPMNLVIRVMACNAEQGKSHYLNQLAYPCTNLLPHDSCSHNKYPGPWFNIKMSSYQYRKSHCGDKTILWPSYLHNGSSYTGKMTSLYWIRALIARFMGPTWGPSGADRTQVGPMLAPWTLLSGSFLLMAQIMLQQNYCGIHKCLHMAVFILQMSGKIMTGVFKSLAPGDVIYDLMLLGQCWFS